MVAVLCMQPILQRTPAEGKACAIGAEGSLHQVIYTLVRGLRQSLIWS